MSTGMKLLTLYFTKFVAAILDKKSNPHPKCCRWQEQTKVVWLTQQSPLPSVDFLFVVPVCICVTKLVLFVQLE